MPGADSNPGEWVYGYFYQFGDRAFIIEPGKPGIPEQHIEVELGSVGQFTGLNDKNEKEIYEGDIVSGEKDLKYLYSEDEPLKRGVVEWAEGVGEYWIDGEAILKEGKVSHIDAFVQLVGTDSDDTEQCASDVEVIGNIHENPELLKV